MMTLRILLTELAATRTTFTVDGDLLRYRGPVSALTPERLAALGYWKSEILYLYGERAAIHEYEGGLTRVEAERRAIDSINHQQNTRDTNP